VDDVTEVDDVRFLPGGVRSVCRVPAACYNSFRCKQFYVFPPPTSVVEEGHVLGDKAVSQEALNRTGEIAAPDRRLVPLNGHLLHTFAPSVATRPPPPIRTTHRPAQLTSDQGEKSVRAYTISL